MANLGLNNRTAVADIRFLREIADCDHDMLKPFAKVLVSKKVQLEQIAKEIELGRDICFDAMSKIRDQRFFYEMVGNETIPYLWREEAVHCCHDQHHILDLAREVKNVKIREMLIGKMDAGVRRAYYHSPYDD